MSQRRIRSLQLEFSLITIIYVTVKKRNASKRYLSEFFFRADKTRCCIERKESETISQAGLIKNNLPSRFHLFRIEFLYLRLAAPTDALRNLAQSCKRASRGELPYQRQHRQSQPSIHDNNGTSPRPPPFVSATQRDSLSSGPPFSPRRRVAPARSGCLRRIPRRNLRIYTQPGLRINALLPSTMRSCRAPASPP